MKFFKHRSEKETQVLKTFKSIFEVLNYSPVLYSSSSQYEIFKASAPKYFADTVKTTQPDAYNSDMFDFYIYGYTACEKAEVKNQYTRHLDAITDHHRMITGNLVRAKEILESLTSDLIEVKLELQKLTDLQKEVQKW